MNDTERPDDWREPSLARPWMVISLYALVSVLVIPVFPHFVSPNELSRWALTVSLIDRGSAEIGWTVQTLGPMEDTARVDGRLYPNKPPGTSFAGIPGYALVRVIGLDAEALRLSLTMMRLAGSTVPVVAIGLLMIRVGRRYRIGDGRISLVLTALLFGTSIFPYGLLYFSHALAGCGLFAAAVFAFLAPLERRWLNGAAIGLGLGLAGWSEYTAAIFVIMILAGLLVERRWIETVGAMLGGAPFLGALLWYHAAAFGNPLAIANAFETFDEFGELAGRGVFGIGLPSPVRAVQLLVDPANGLFLFSPILIVALVLFRRVRGRVPTAGFWILIAIPAAAILLFSGYPNWHGGWTVGPRYLVPVIPMLAVPLLFGVRNRIEAVLVGWSVFAVVLTTTTFPFVPNELAFPWGSVGLAMIRDGLVAPNLFHLVAPVLGTALPWLLLAAVAVLVPRESIAPLVGGMALCLVAGIIALATSSPLARLQRCYLQEVYFGDRGAYEREFGEGFRPPESLQERAVRELGRPPGDWPFR